MILYFLNKNPMNKNPIINKFYIIYPPHKTHTMYCHLNDNTYTKTHTLNNKIISDHISIDEYAAALMDYITHGHNLDIHAQDNT